LYHCIYGLILPLYAKSFNVNLLHFIVITASNSVTKH
jgi:hypothetical protein